MDLQIQIARHLVRQSHRDDDPTRTRTFFSSSSTAAISTPFRTSASASDPPCVPDEPCPCPCPPGSSRLRAPRTSTSTRSSSTCSGRPTSPIAGFAPSSGRNCPNVAPRGVGGSATRQSEISLSSQDGRGTGGGPVPGETNAQPAYAPMRPTWLGKRAKRWRRTGWVEARGTKKTSLSFCAGAIAALARDSNCDEWYDFCSGECANMLSSTTSFYLYMILDTSRCYSVVVITRDFDLRFPETQVRTLVAP